MALSLGFGRALRLTGALLAFSFGIHATEQPEMENVPSAPSQDPFYRVPSDVYKHDPGTILRHRKTPKPIAVFGTTFNLEASHHILYRTTDNFGEATATVLTVMIPPQADKSKVLSFQVAEDAASIDCAPSYVFQLRHDRGPDLGTLFTELHMPFIDAALKKGWVVISPDFQGPDSAYLANRLAGQATLDGIRAAINSGSFTGVGEDPTVSMWGYSGGSFSSLWAAELQPEYAPELKFAGAAVGGLGSSISSAIAANNGSKSAGLIAGAVSGLANAYPKLRQIIDKHILPMNRNRFNKALHQCSLANRKQFSEQDVLALFDDRSLFFTNPDIVTILEENDIGKRTPRIRLLAYKAVDDEVSPINETDRLIEQYCAAGASVEYQRYEASKHIDLFFKAGPKALSWLDDTMNHRNHQTGCETHTTSLAV